ncbi:hypothetical protein [Streptomyces sp. NPDC002402]
MIEDDAGKVRAALPAYMIEVGTEPLDRPTRNSVGGWPFLDDGQEWPRCFCGERMALFFQLDVPADVEAFGGDHLLVFHCGAHNEASDPVTADGRLVPRYWAAPQPPHPGTFWRVLLQRDAARPTTDREPAVRALPLTLRPAAWRRRAATSSGSRSGGGSTEPPGSCQRPGEVVQGDIRPSSRRPSSAGCAIATKRDGSRTLAQGTRRRT